MGEIKTYSFPSLEKDGLVAVEEKYVELKRKYDEGEIDPVELDFFDYANSVLLGI